jgi:hypothetical protein
LTSQLELQEIGKQCTFRKANYHCCWSIELQEKYPDYPLQERINQCKGCSTFQDWLEHFNPSERICFCDVCKKLRAKGIKI